MDDDVLMNILELEFLLKKFKNQKNIVLCRTFLNGQITRNPKSKWLKFT